MKQISTKSETKEKKRHKGLAAFTQIGPKNHAANDNSRRETHKAADLKGHRSPKDWESSDKMMREQKDSDGDTMSKSAFTLIKPKAYDRNEVSGREITRKAAFTLIELIVVMAVIGILTLLATPKFLGYAKKAKMVQIINDVAVTENVVDHYLIEQDTLPDEWTTLTAAEINEMTEGKTVYSTRGEATSIVGTEFRVLPKQYVKKNTRSNLKGTFIASNEGNVYYVGEEIAGSTPVVPTTPMRTPFDIVPVVPNGVVINNEFIKIVDIKYPTGYFRTGLPGERLTAEVTVEAVQAGDYYLTFEPSYQKTGEWWDDPWESSRETYFWLEAGETATFSVSSLINGWRTGYVDVRVNLFRDGSGLQAAYAKTNSLYIGHEEWTYFYSDDWKKTDRASIGAGALSSANVTLGYEDNSSVPGILSDHGTVRITSPAGSNVTGMINSAEPAPYGTYEARIKVPNSDALLNGFFLYGPDDHEYEIDIEVLKYEGKWQMWTTIHNSVHPNFTEMNAPFDKIDNPGAIFQRKIILCDLGIDPSATYNDYKIEFYPNYIAFSLNNTEVSRWNGTFHYGHMNLLVSTFYAQWLSKDISGAEQLDVKWVRRMTESQLLD